MRLSVFGAGYAGLVTGSCFAELGNEVLVCDVDAAKIASLAKGEVPIYEPGLEEIIKRNLKEGRLSFGTDTAAAAKFGEVIFLAVGTPEGKDGAPEMKYIHSVADTIGDNLSEDKRVVIIKSTVPVGTAKEVRKRISAKLAARGASPEFAIVSNPEFLKEGDAIADFTHPDRIVIGFDAEWAKSKMDELYRPITKPGHPIFFMDNSSAELSKYAANTFLAARISLMNQIAQIAEAVGADIEEVRRSLAADQRIGRHFLYPGLGYGGSCFPKDIAALGKAARDAGLEPEMINAIQSVNAGLRERFAANVVEKLGGVKDKKLAVWGLAFKPKTNDMRQAPSREIIGKLLAEGAEITAYDPITMEEAKKVLNGKVQYAKDMYSALEGADALLVITEWAPFREPDLERMGKLLKNKIIFDGRNIYEPQRMRELGFTYYGIGRRS